MRRFILCVVCVFLGMMNVLASDGNIQFDDAISLMKQYWYSFKNVKLEYLQTNNLVSDNKTKAESRVRFIGALSADKFRCDATFSQADAVETEIFSWDGQNNYYWKYESKRGDQGDNEFSLKLPGSGGVSRKKHWLPFPNYMDFIKMIDAESIFAERAKVLNFRIESVGKKTNERSVIVLKGDGVEIYVDQEIGMIVRMCSYYEKECQHKMFESDVFRVKSFNNIWIPTNVRYRTYADRDFQLLSDYNIKIKDDSVQINCDIDESVFALKFPDGSVVYDADIKRTKFVHRTQDGKEKIPIDEQLEKIVDEAKRRMH